MYDWKVQIKEYHISKWKVLIQYIRIPKYIWPSCVYQSVQISCQVHHHPFNIIYRFPETHSFRNMLNYFSKCHVNGIFFSEKLFHICVVLMFFMVLISQILKFQIMRCSAFVWLMVVFVYMKFDVSHDRSVELILARGLTWDTSPLHHAKVDRTLISRGLSIPLLFHSSAIAFDDTSATL